MSNSKRPILSFSLSPGVLDKYLGGSDHVRFDHDDYHMISFLLESLVNVQVYDTSVRLSFSGKYFKSLLHFQRCADSLFHGSRYFYFADIDDFYGIEISHYEFVQCLIVYAYISSNDC